MAKLRKIQLDGVEIELLESYLSNRSQVVQVGECTSSTRLVRKGVPQGSIIGPLLFNIYINDMAHLKLHGHLQLYADDAVLKYSSENLVQLQEFMQQDLKALEEWFNNNLLALSESKSKFMIFGSKIPSDTHFSLRYKEVLIERVYTFRYLGLMIDHNLRWNQHVEKVKSEIVPYIFVIKKLKNCLSLKMLTMIYDSYISSRINYLLPIWYGCPNYILNELRILQKRAIKYIRSLPTRFPTAELYNQKFVSIDTMVKRQMLILAHRIIHNKIRHDFYLRKHSDVHSYGTRGRSDYCIDFMRLTKCQKNNVLVKALSLYNDIDDMLKSISCSAKFIGAIKQLEF